MSNELIAILGVFGKYRIEYDIAEKIIIINNPINTRDFYAFVRYVKGLKDKINDIRVVDKNNIWKRGM